MFKKIQTTLQEITNQETNRDYIEYQKIKKRWKREIDKNIQKNAKIIDFTKGVLTIKAKKTTWKNEILFMQEDIKKNFQTTQTQ